MGRWAWLLLAAATSGEAAGARRVRADPSPAAEAGEAEAGAPGAVRLSPAEEPRSPVARHPEPAYHFAAEVEAELASLAARRPGVVEARTIGRSVEGRPIVAWRVRRPGDGTAFPHAPREPQRLLVFANIHAMEWISTEVALGFAEWLVAHPVAGVEVTVVPILNPDGRARVERDLLDGRNAYRRGNARGVDLNRDFAVNREARAVWRRVIPAYYATSPAPLSQPETRALDRLAAAGRFHAAVSLHAFGGFVYYPWAGSWERAPDRRDFVELGDAMVAAQPPRAYHVRQLARWAFFFRGHGMELDHLYGRYGTRAFLVELTRSGLSPLRPAEWKRYFRWYNPRDPAPHVRSGVAALRALARRLAADPLPEPQPPARLPPTNGPG